MFSLTGKAIHIYMPTNRILPFSFRLRSAPLYCSVYRSCSLSDLASVSFFFMSCLHSIAFQVPGVIYFFSLTSLKPRQDLLLSAYMDDTFFFMLSLDLIQVMSNSPDGISARALESVSELSDKGSSHFWVL